MPATKQDIKKMFTQTLEDVSTLCYRLKNADLRSQADLDKTILIAEEIMQTLNEECTTKSGITNIDLIEKVFATKENTKVVGYKNIEVRRTVEYTDGHSIEVTVQATITDDDTLKISDEIDVATETGKTYGVSLKQLGYLSDMLENMSVV